MSKLNYGSNKDNTLNMKVKSKLDEQKIRKIRKELLSLAEMDIKASKSYNVIVIKNDENVNKIALPTICPQRNNNEDFERFNQNEINIENDENLDQSEMANSSDFENEDDEF